MQCISWPSLLDGQKDIQIGSSGQVQFLMLRYGYVSWKEGLAAEIVEG